ncbi:MAG TPA: alkaline phosphatase family protein [Gemmatimonadales bacterium]|nr:alkaline phosphatase family protein [Gemmatimonadales bacterium]
MAGAVACAATSRPATPASTASVPAGHRAILVSFDALNERRVLATLPAAAVPNFRAVFDSGACADYARPAFPSITAPGHASIWTGAYGDVNGITANSQPRLPVDAYTLLQLGSGFSASALRAEPIWLTAVRSGLRVAGHHVTQSPGAPGYPPITSRDTAGLGAKRAAALALLRDSSVLLVNGYEGRITGDTVLTDSAVARHPASNWAGLDRLPSDGPAPMEIAWKLGSDSVFGLLFGPGGNTYTSVLVAPVRDARRGVVAHAEPVETTPIPGRPLARHFSDPLSLELRTGRAIVRYRLFALRGDGGGLALYQPSVTVIQGNRPDVAAEYAAAAGGWTPGAATRLLERGALGTPATRGGDGTAEARLLETAELATLTSMRGAEWVWHRHRPALMLDYFLLGDEIDHALYGFVIPESPRYDSALAARVQETRARAWALVDLRLASLRRLAAEAPATALFVTGDHGMRGTWREFRPNVALAAAGLLAVDPQGRIDLARTKALSPTGDWVSVNRVARRGGTVAPESEDSVLYAAEAALLAARRPDGEAVVTGVWRARDTDTLGMGGPVGGDLYYDVAPGYRWTARATGPVTGDAPPQGGHGYPPLDPDMAAVLCATGPGFGPRRVGPAALIDVAPTVSAWLGIPPPANARGRSRLAQLQGERTTAGPVR